MNSVMDDNKLLTLASNERIPLKPHMRLVFEIRDLRFASPATVSRAGIIYISTQTGSQWRSLVKTWIARLDAGASRGSGGTGGSSTDSSAKMHARLHAPPLGASSSSSSSSGGGSTDDAAAAVAPSSLSSSDAPPSSPLARVLRGLFDRYVGPALLFLKKECKPIVPVEDVTHVTNLLRLLDATLTPELLGRLGDAGRTPPDEAARALETHFVFASLWALGGALAAVDGEDYRAKFSSWWRSEFTAVRLPSRDTVFDYWLNPGTLAFDSWKAAPLFREVAFDSRTTAMAAVTVPTPETVAISHWADLLLRGRAPVMLAGYAGCGKTQLVNGLLASSASPPGGSGGGGERASATVNFNFFTDSKALQATLEAPLEKKTGSNYGPRGAGAAGGLVFFLDDLNLPEVDRYDTQSAIALVRQHLDYGHWYDRAKLSAKTVLGCQYVAAMNPSAGSFTVNPRLQRHFTTLAVGFPGPGSLHTIFSTFLEGHLRSRGFAEEVQAGSQALLSGALALHAAVAGAFRKSATNFHYEFSVRHLAAVFGGLLQAGPAEFREPGKLAALWLHESERVYGDRLASVEDVARYRALAAGVAKKKFAGAVGASLASFFGDRPDALLFSHFSSGDGGAGARVYDRVPTTDKLRHVVEDSLREYNETLPAMVRAIVGMGLVVRLRGFDNHWLVGSLTSLTHCVSYPTPISPFRPLRTWCCLTRRWSTWRASRACCSSHRATRCWWAWAAPVSSRWRAWRRSCAATAS
jgi:dynein heavy chain, axonemal